MSDGMDEIIDDFVAEAEEAIERIDPLFLELEEKGFDKDILNEIFRSMHTIKGAAGFLGFQGIVDVAHRTESLLKKLRDEEIGISTDLISLVLGSVDMLKALLGHIKRKDGRAEDLAPLLADLESALSGIAPKPGAAEKQAKTRKPEPKKPEAKEKPSAAKKAAVQPETTGPKIQPELRPEPFIAPEPVAETPVSAPPAKAVEAEAIKEAAPSSDAQAQTPFTQPPAAPDAAAAAKANQQTLRVDVERIDKVMNLTGEIVLVRNRLLNLGNFLEQKYPGDHHVEGLQETVSFLDLVTSDIQLAVMKMRMQPIKKVFSKFPRLVRDISQNLGKEVQLNIYGEDTEVDRSVIERIGDPMVHIIRNAIDHGIESMEERVSKGKPSKGLVEISAFQQGNQIVIEVTDDGRGMDVERIKRKALSSGIITEDEAQRLTEKEAINLIFLPGFSTVDVATELSGRGVGMDVVKTNISKLNGYVEIFSTKDVGSTLRISIPLTLAIIQALMVRTSGVQYAIPLGPIEETLKISVGDIRHVTGNRVVTIRDRVYPLAELTDMLGYYGISAGKQSRYVLVMAIGDRKFCVAVDELIGQEEVVIKAIEGIDTDSTGILGATITGEGKIVLILDPQSMSKIITGIAAIK